MKTVVALLIALTVVSVAHAEQVTPKGDGVEITQVKTISGRDKSLSANIVTTSCQDATQAILVGGCRTNGNGRLKSSYPSWDAKKNSDSWICEYADTGAGESITAIVQCGDRRN